VRERSVEDVDVVKAIVDALLQLMQTSFPLGILLTDALAADVIDYAPDDAFYAASIRHTGVSPAFKFAHFAQKLIRSV
jgi:hypothetical protein